MKVSVIVPVYNVQDYLEKCLNSIVNQIEDEFEIILVDDGSTDKSLKIIEKFKENYQQIKIIKKENGGLSSARNAGLKIATGKFVLFVDSDDFIDYGMISTLYKEACDNDADIVICKFKFYYADNQIKEQKVKYQQTILSNEQAVNFFLLNKITGHAWNKLIRRELMLKNNIKFPEGMLYEDAPTIFKLLNVAKTVSLVNQSFYNYVQRPNSITKQFSVKSLFDHLDILELIFKMEDYAINKKDKAMINNYAYTQIYYSLSIFKNIENLPQKYKEEYINKLKFIKTKLNSLIVISSIDSTLKVKLKSIIVNYKLKKLFTNDKRELGGDGFVR